MEQPALARSGRAWGGAFWALLGFTQATVGGGHRAGRAGWLCAAGIQVDLLLATV